MKKVFFSFVLAVTLILPVSVNAKELVKSFEIAVPNSDFAELIFPSYDNSGNVDGHYLLGDGFYKYNLKNELVFGLEEYYDTELEEIQIETIYKTDNSNVKGNSDIKISSSNFEILYGGTGDEYEVYYGSLPSFDNAGNHDGYVMILFTTSTDIPGIKPGCVTLKIDLKGNVVWQKNNNLFSTFDTSFYNSHYRVYYDAYSYIKDKSGKEYLYAFDILYEDNSEGFYLPEKAVIKKFNYNDNIAEAVPMKAIENSKLFFSIKYSYNASGEIDGFVTAGYDKKTEKAVIVKYDLDLNEVFTYSVDEKKAGLFYSVINSKNEKGVYDGYIAVGCYSDDEEFDNYTGIIKKVDYSGKEVWQDTYEGSYESNLLFTITENYNELGAFNGYVVSRQSANDYDENQREFSWAKYTYPGHKITNQASDEGTIAVNNEAYPGEIVKVKVSPSVGYSLKRIVVMTSSGKEVEVDSNGTFVMPDEEVTVLALYNKVSNPSTLSACYIVLGIVLLISLGTLIVTKKKALD